MFNQYCTVLLKTTIITQEILIFSIFINTLHQLISATFWSDTKFCSSWPRKTFSVVPLFCASLTKKGTFIISIIKILFLLFLFLTVMIRARIFYIMLWFVGDKSDPWEVNSCTNNRMKKRYQQTWFFPQIYTFILAIPFAYIKRKTILLFPRTGREYYSEERVHIYRELLK